MLLIFISFAVNSSLVTGQGYSKFDVTTLNGRSVYSYNEVPDQLVPYNYTTPATFQWEQSQTPVNGFQPIPDATQPTYTFTSPLQQTTYFRRKTTFSGVLNYYSNIVKIEVVSVNHENISYIREHDVLVAGQTDWKAIDVLPIGQKLQTTTYLDGIGRPVQKVSRETATPDPSQQNSLWGDVVQYFKYDAFGKQTTQYLPYTTTTESGRYKSAPLSEQPQYYANVYNETSAFSTSTYDNSPLNRVMNVKAPGTSWAAGPGNSALYSLNELADNVQIFGIGYTSGSAPLRLGAYPAKTLFKTVHTDEKGKQVVEYVNQSGQLILKKVQVDDNMSAAHEGWICVYSVYDDFGLLRYRIQPEGVKYLDANGWSFGGTNGQKVLDEFCFRYEYDEKGRNTLKKAPGAKELKMLYDGSDRVVFMQDGNQRAKSPGEWTANLYDELDRAVITTLYNTSKTVSALQTDIDNAATISTVTVTGQGGAVADLVVGSRDANISQYTAQNTIEFTTGFESMAGDEFVAELNPSGGGQPVNVTTVTYKTRLLPLILTAHR